MPTADQLIAKILERAGEALSGLALDEIEEDGHVLANKMWKVAAHLRKRASK